jgi:hypothetical protein
MPRREALFIEEAHMACRTLAGFFTLATLLAGRISSVAAQSTEPRQLALRVPDSLADFRMVARKDFDDAARSVMLRYSRADGLVADVFVYPGPDFARDCDVVCARNVFKREGDEFLELFPELIRRQYVDSIGVVSDSVLTPSADGVWRLGRHVRLRQRRNGEEQWSDFYLYYVPDYRLKVRASYGPDTAAAKSIARLAGTVAFAFSRGRTVVATAPDSGDTRGTRISTTLAGLPSAVYGTLSELLGKQGYTLEDSSLAQGRLVTNPRYEWPKGSETESWHGATSPGVRLTVFLTPSGDSTKVDILGESPTRAGWTDANVARTLQVLSVMQFASSLPKTQATGSAAKKP